MQNIKQRFNNKQKNAGMTLAELMVCFAIIGIIILILDRYLFSSTNLFKKGKNEVNLQIELQTVSEYISDQLLECKYVEALPIDAGGKQRYILQKTQSDIQATGMIIIFDKSNKKIQYRSVTVLHSELTGGDTEDEKYRNKLRDYAGVAYDTDDKGILSTLVQEFSLTDVTGSGTIYSIEVTVENDGKQLSCTKQVKLRNS